MHTKIRQMDKPSDSKSLPPFVHPFPHLKLVKEAFPRLLATRRIVDDGSEYFGAFLNRTSVRILIDFLNRTFRLRSCDIHIDGSFSVPCTQYYSRRCIAPCVSSLCSSATYEKAVDLVRLFAGNDRAGLRAEFRQRIDRSAAVLDFERAAGSRDILTNLETFWANPRWNVWLEDTIDTYRIESATVTLLSQRRNRTLGKTTFELPEKAPPGRAIYDLVKGIYRFHAPREIRVSLDFPERQNYAQELGQRFGREVRIKVVTDDKLTLTAARAFEVSRREAEFQNATPLAAPGEIAGRLRDVFGLPRIPKTIEAYDVAHISATVFVAAAITKSVKGGELSALRDLISRRSASGNNPPDILLVDGGPAQLNAAISALPPFILRNSRVIAAVKPEGRHSQISHFLTEAGERVEFDERDPAHKLLIVMRDEVHELANSVHRLARDMVPFYELASVLPSLDEAQRQKLLTEFGSIRKILEATEASILSSFDARTGKAALKDRANYKKDNYSRVAPLIVPIRLDESGGDAEDLRPILTP